MEGSVEEDEGGPLWPWPVGASLSDFFRPSTESEAGSIAAFFSLSFLPGPWLPLGSPLLGVGAGVDAVAASFPPPLSAEAEPLGPFLVGDVSSSTSLSLSLSIRIWSWCFLASEAAAAKASSFFCEAAELFDKELLLLLVTSPLMLSFWAFTCMAAARLVLESLLGRVVILLSVFCFRIWDSFLLLLLAAPLLSLPESLPEVPAVEDAAEDEESDLATDHFPRLSAVSFLALAVVCPELVSREVVEAEDAAEGAGVLSMRSLFWEDEAAEEVAGGFGEAGLEDPPPEATSRACSEAADLRPPAPLPVLAVSSLSDLSPPGAAGGVEGALCDARSGH